MKKSELVLGQSIKGYKGETIYEITSIGKESVMLNGEKEVKISTLLKNFKVVEKEVNAEASTDINLGSDLTDMMAMVLDSEIDTTEPEVEEEIVPVVEEIEEEEPEAEPEIEVPVDDITDETEPEATPVEEEVPAEEAKIEEPEPEAEKPAKAPKAKAPKEPKQKKEKVTGYIYGVPVIYGNVNQTTIWKILKEVCKNKDDEGTKVANDLYKNHKEVFEGAKRCLVTKKRIAYIDSILEENN